MGYVPTDWGIGTWDLGLVNGVVVSKPSVMVILSAFLLKPYSLLPIPQSLSSSFQSEIAGYYTYGF